jgi:hypothetical protein
MILKNLKDFRINFWFFLSFEFRGDFLEFGIFLGFSGIFDGFYSGKGRVL